MADSTNDSPEQMPDSFWKRSHAIFVMLVIFMLLMCIGAYGYFQWFKVETVFKKNMSDLHQATTSHQIAIVQLQKTIDGLQKAVNQSEARVLQQAQVIHNIQGVQQGHYDTWRAAEAAYLVKLANDHVQFTYDVAMAIVLLERAEEVLQPAEDATLLNIRQSIVADIARFKMVPSINVTQFYQQLTTVDQQLDQLPLAVLQSTIKSDEENMHTPVLPWWKIGLNQSLAILKKIVIIHRQVEGATPLILPQEKTFLYQHLHAQVDNMIWSVMYRQPIIYEASLNRLIKWIQQYFDQSSILTHSILSTLQGLKKQDIRPTLENLNITLQQFEQYFSSQNKMLTQALLKQSMEVMPMAIPKQG